MSVNAEFETGALRGLCIDCHHSSVRPAVPDAVHARVALGNIHHVAGHFLVRGGLGQGSEFPAPHLHCDVRVCQQVAVPVRVAAPAGCHAVAVIFAVVFVFERRVARQSAFAPGGGQQQDVAPDHPAQAELVLQDGQLENPLEHRANVPSAGRGP